jgi:hypothetical protein
VKLVIKCQGAKTSFAILASWLEIALAALMPVVIGVSSRGTAELYCILRRRGLRLRSFLRGLSRRRRRDVRRGRNTTDTGHGNGLLRVNISASVDFLEPKNLRQSPLATRNRGPMRLTFSLSMYAALALIAHAQQPPPQPPLLSCGVHGAAEVLCGTRSPEDIEIAPDGKHLIVSEYVSFRGGTGGGFSLFDPASKAFSKIAITEEPLKDWGDPACPGPPGEKLAPHGISLLKRATGPSKGKVQLYVVNHGGRESIEMFEVKEAGGTVTLVWHGCVVSAKEFNDVAALADGGFFASHPTALRTQGTDLFSGQPWLCRKLDPREGRGRIAGHSSRLSQRRDRNSRWTYSLLQRVDGQGGP